MKHDLYAGEAMAAVRLICPWCKAPIKADSSQTGSTIPCPKCQSDVVVSEGAAPVRPQAIQPSTVAPVAPQPASPQPVPLQPVPLAQGFVPTPGPPASAPYGTPPTGAIPYGVPLGSPPSAGPVGALPQSGMFPQGGGYPQGPVYPQGPAYPQGPVYPQSNASSGFFPSPAPGAAPATGLPDFGAPAPGSLSGGMPAMGGMGLDPLGGGLPPLGLPSLPSGPTAAGGKGAAPASDAFANLPYVVGGSVLAALVVALLIVVPFLASRKGPPKPPEPEVAAVAPSAPSAGTSAGRSGAAPRGASVSASPPQPEYEEHWLDRLSRPRQGGGPTGFGKTIFSLGLGVAGLGGSALMLCMLMLVSAGISHDGLGPLVLGLFSRSYQREYFAEVHARHPRLSYWFMMSFCVMVLGFAAAGVAHRFL